MISISENDIIHLSISFILFTHDKPEAVIDDGRFILGIFNADNKFVCFKASKNSEA